MLAFANGVRSALGFSDSDEPAYEPVKDSDIEVADIQMNDDVDDESNILSNMMGRVKSVMGIEEEKRPQTTLEYITSCGCIPPLTWEQRLWGFGIFFGFGCLISFLSTFSLAQIMYRPAKFAMTYTLGNLLSICSLMFLMGPCNQLKKMFDPERRSATLVYLGSMIVTVVAVFRKVPGYFVLPLISFQFCALVWYSATYIPYGRDILKGFVKNCCACCCSGLF
mmetsp:Transcript_32945/g.53487  ORF Transcript_32945/g.53487 Transcript_32945/m.53487 type:complete len:223 (-) Transcript_32945:140-808(-)|eukprot:jgi/Bigna1/91388/estExt_fgenesh1_pg.C_990038